MVDRNKELFKNKTKCTKKEYDTFVAVHSKENSPMEFSKMAFYVFLGIIIFVLSILNKEYKLTIVLFIWLILYITVSFTLSKKRMENQEKSDRLLKEYVNTYKFYKYYFKTETPDGTAETLYFKIYKVIETETNFYIYISQDYAFIVSKDGFIDCESSEFAKFLRKKIKLKYKNIINKK